MRRSGAARTVAASAVGVMVVVGGLVSPAAAAAGRTIRVSVTPDGRYSGGFSGVISADGRYVAISTVEPALSPADTNSVGDVYLRDLRTGTITLVSITPQGKAGSYDSYDAGISADGRYVSFTSVSPDLVPGDDNERTDIFVRDMRTGRTIIANRSTTGEQAGGDGFTQSFGSSLSADGRYVSFTSSAPNLVPGDDNNDVDVFVRDLRARTTTRVSAPLTGAASGGGSGSGATISADGRLVSFRSWAADLVRGDTNDESDFFVRDLRTGRTSRVNLSNSGGQADGGICCGDASAISGDGRFVAFLSTAGGMVPGFEGGWNLYVRDRRTNTTTVAGRADDDTPLTGDLESVAINHDGHYVGFSTRGAGVPGDTNSLLDVYVRDRKAGRTHLASVSSTGALGNRDSAYPYLSGNGRTVVFGTYASTLVPGDTNGEADVFAHTW
jgi:WD40-like Beta Propeller Repeat